MISFITFFIIKIFEPPVNLNIYNRFNSTVTILYESYRFIAEEYIHVGQCLHQRIFEKLQN